MSILDDAIGIIQDNPLGSAVGAGIIGAGLGATAVAVMGGSGKTGSKRTYSASGKRKRITHTKRGWKQDRKRKSKQKWEVAYRKRKARRGRIHKSSKRKGKHYTKNGQPYIILASGKARFVKK